MSFYNFRIISFIYYPYIHYSLYEVVALTDCDSNFCALPLSSTAKTILDKRYLIRDENRDIIETPEEMFHRVARFVSTGDSDLEGQFYGLMSRLDFLPNSPTLMNAGTELGQLSACFVLPIEDDMKSIMMAVMNSVLIHKSGGGTGFSFGRLRPNGDVVNKTGGVASGPLSFMKIFNVSTEVIKQGGKRRGANMGILPVHHPDIFDFLVAKEQEGNLNNFNLSVAVTDEFMKAVKNNDDFTVINPRTKRSAGTFKARSIWNLLINMTWMNGEPAIVFIDTINKKNPLLKALGPIESTNPCAEQPLYAYESCNLGSINLGNHVNNGRINWKKLAYTVKVAVRFLDNVIDINKFPLPEIEEMTKKTRKIGLGVMGFADMLIKLRVKYGSPKSVSIAKKVMKFIQKGAREMSVELGESKGNFPLFNLSSWVDKYPFMRNATVTTIAPTGSISMIAGCNYGIEPLFGLTYEKDLSASLGEKFSVVHPLYSEETAEYFVTAMDLTPEEHLSVQAAFQQYVDNAVSKTINLHQSATPNDVSNAYWWAYKLGLKGVSMYRNGSRENQIIDMKES